MAQSTRPTGTSVAGDERGRRYARDGVHKNHREARAAPTSAFASTAATRTRSASAAATVRPHRSRSGRDADELTSTPSASALAWLAGRPVPASDGMPPGTVQRPYQSGAFPRSPIGAGRAVVADLTARLAGRSSQRRLSRRYFPA